MWDRAVSLDIQHLDELCQLIWETYPPRHINAYRDNVPGMQFNRHFIVASKPVPNSVRSFDTCLNFIYPSTEVVLEIVPKTVPKPHPKS